MAKVYVVQESPGKNILGVQVWGDVEILLPPGQVVFSTEPTIMRLKEKLRNYGDEDYLLLIGDPAAIGMASVIAANYNQGRLNMLKYDRQEKKYFPIKTRCY